MKGSCLGFILVILDLGVTGGCGQQRHEPAAVADPRYTVGRPWQGDGYWFYPTEELTYEATGLAVIDTRPASTAHLTADGETYDPAIPAGAHQTLQLPVILRVRNLENGLEIMLRVNDRGPSSPGRLLSVTPRAAQLLRMVPGEATRVRVTEDEAMSRSLWGHVKGTPAPDIVAAPVGAVQERSLMPDNVPSGGQPAAAQPSPSEPEMPQLQQVVAGSADPGELWVDAGRFSEPRYARHLALMLAGAVHQDGHGRSASFSVRTGPFERTAEADAALDRARSAGVTGARIIVE